MFCLYLPLQADSGIDVAFSVLQHKLSKVLGSSAQRIENHGIYAPLLGPRMLIIEITCNDARPRVVVVYGIALSSVFLPPFTPEQTREETRAAGHCHSASSSAPSSLEDPLAAQVAPESCLDLGIQTTYIRLSVTFALLDC